MDISTVIYSAICIILTPSVNGQMTGGNQTWKHSYYRLPQTLAPINYTMRIIPFLDEGNFSTAGEIWITFKCVENTDRIIFNVNNLTIAATSVSVFEMTEYGANLSVINQSEDQVTQTYTVEVYPPLTTGKIYMMYMKYVAVLNDILQGFYRSSYLDPKTGEKRWLATTQFSPTEARRAFPCWDEPMFKATFTLSLGRTKNYTSLSNMPLNSTTPMEGLDDWEWDHYYPSLKMSTYLVAFIVSQLQSSGVTVLPSGLKFQVFSKKDSLQQTKYATDITPKILNYLEDYFDVKLPLQKLDLVAIPDFGYGAMENWGLITFRESVLFYDNKVSPLKDKAVTAMIVAHELTHQWFGNYVTPAWWVDLWLKEGFAMYIGCIAVGHVDPDGRFLDQFVVEVAQNAMVFDSLASSHQISIQLESPSDISQIFNLITYYKSASIIHMMKHFISRESFKQGLQDYLKTFAYSTAKQDQLWEMMTNSIQDGWLPYGVTVKDIMDSWTLQVGYPVITVIRDYKKGTATVTQERFLLSGKKDDNNLLWWVPVSYTIQSECHFNDTRPKLWLRKVKSVKMSQLPGSQWLLLNLKRTGFYRVNYDKDNWEMLTTDYHNLPEVIRAQLLNDALSLARAGFTKYAIALNLTRQIGNDESYFAWASVQKEFTFIHDMLIHTPAFTSLNIYLQNLLRLRDLNLTVISSNLTNDFIERLHKGNVIALACKLEFPPIVLQIQNLINDWITNKVEPLIDASLKSAVYCASIANSNSSVWEHFWNVYMNDRMRTDKVLILRALGCSKEEEILSRYLKKIIDPNSGVRKQDGSIVFIAVAENKHGYHLAFEFLSNHWHDIQQYFGQGFGQVSKMVDILSKYFNNRHQLEKMIALQSTHMNDLGSTSLTLRQTIEHVRTNLAWFESYYDEISLWLQSAIVMF